MMYEAFEDTPHATLAKMIFTLYMILVTLLLINMLIAMMGEFLFSYPAWDTVAEWLESLPLTLKGPRSEHSLCVGFF